MFGPSEKRLKFSENVNDEDEVSEEVVSLVNKSSKAQERVQIEPVTGETSNGLDRQKSGNILKERIASEHACRTLYVYDPAFSQLSKNSRSVPNVRPADNQQKEFSYRQRHVFRDQFDQVRQAFEKNCPSIADECFTLDGDNFQSTHRYYQSFCSKFQQSQRTIWMRETGESSRASEVPTISEKPKLVGYVCSVGRKEIILGKCEITDPVQRFVRPRPCEESSETTLDIRNLSIHQIKEKYTPPQSFISLNKVIVGIHSNVYGVVTAINKLPVKETNKVLWHSLFCISDPSLQSDESTHPEEFKIHTFFHFQSDFPELHRGDIVRIANVKVESHVDRKDGRIFKSDDLKVFCCRDSNQPPLRETRDSHLAAIRLLVKWWDLNEKFFDLATPRPCFSAGYRFSGIRTLQEVSDGLVINLYCQVFAHFTSGNFYGLAVRDGTVFTLLRNQTYTSCNRKNVVEHTHRNPKNPDYMEQLLEKKTCFLKKNFGYVALLMMEKCQRHEVQYLGIQNGDFVMLHQATVKFCEESLFQKGGNFPFQSPCVFLTLSSTRVCESLTKLERNHHEAYKIEKRLHKLPETLERMENWELPREDDEAPKNDILQELSSGKTQLQLLRNMQFCT